MASTDKKLHWGIAGAGKISHDFVSALTSSVNHQVVAVGSRSAVSANAFAQLHDIPVAYGSYDELIADSKVSIVYVGLVNSEHFPIARKSILNGKHVLCEKPLCINAKESKALVDLARKHKVFLMEGIWTRHFPSLVRLKELLKPESIGEVVQITANLGISYLSNVDNCRLNSLGGGSLLCVGVYCVQFATLIFGNDPIKIVAAGHLNSDSVDESMTAILTYPGGRTATLMSHVKVTLDNQATIIGTKGTITIPSLFCAPLTLITPEGKAEVFPEPECKRGITFNYDKSSCLVYQAEEARRCISKGLFESPRMSHNDSLGISRIMDEIRKQVGVRYQQDQD